MHIRRRYSGSDRIEVQRRLGPDEAWQATDFRSALGYDPPFTEA